MRYGRRAKCREMVPDTESNKNNNRRRSLKPASELHLEVPCFAVRPPGLLSAAAESRESSVHTGIEQERTILPAAQLDTVSVPLASLMTDMTFSAAQSDHECDDSPASPAAVLSRTSDSTEETRQNFTGSIAASD